MTPACQLFWNTSAKVYFEALDYLGYCDLLALQPTNHEIDNYQTNSSDDEWDLNYFSDENDFGDDVSDSRSSKNDIYENVQLRNPSLAQVDAVDAVENQMTTMTTNETITKSQKVIEEFCKTEKAYVSRLGLIGEVSCMCMHNNCKDVEIDICSFRFHSLYAICIHYNNNIQL